MTKLFISFHFLTSSTSFSSRILTIHYHSSNISCNQWVNKYHHRVMLERPTQNLFCFYGFNSNSFRFYHLLCTFGSEIFEIIELHSRYWLHMAITSSLSTWTSPDINLVDYFFPYSNSYFNFYFNSYFFSWKICRGIS